MLDEQQIESPKLASSGLKLRAQRTRACLLITYSGGSQAAQGEGNHVWVRHLSQHVQRVALRWSHPGTSNIVSVRMDWKIFKWKRDG